MSLYAEIRTYMIRKYPTVISEYSQWLTSHGNNTLTRRLRAYAHLLGLVLRSGEKTKKIKKGEYEDNQRESVESYIKRCEEYDVVSFDVFDTLILRCVDRPEDIFRLLEAVVGYAGFTQIRKKVEEELTEDGIVTIGNIYDRLHERYGIEKQVLDKEFELELKLSSPNPFMLELYKRLMDAGKCVIAVSDMYWPAEQIETILKKCGYPVMERVFVSCDEKKSKADGTLFEWIRKEAYPGKKIIHLGDNYNADVDMARRNGIAAYHYGNVFNQGYRYRVDSKGKAYGLSVANALVNREIHSGVTPLRAYERFGFIYGGLLTAGFCHYVNLKGREIRADKLLFFARDTDIVYKSYNQCYREFDCEYVYASRNVLCKLAFQKYPDIFLEMLFKRWLIEKGEQVTLGNVLKENGVDCLIDKLPEYGLSEDDLFQDKHLKAISEMLFCYKEEILHGFQDIYQAAKDYWKRVAGNAKRLLIVDIGWRASAKICLDYWLHDVCKLDVSLFIVQMGSHRTYFNEAEFEKDEIFSYCFSSDLNKNIGEELYLDILKLEIFEKIFSAAHPTLLSYKRERDGAKPVFAKANDTNNQIVTEIQTGILSFVKDYHDVESQLDFDLMVPGCVAMEPLMNLYRSNQYLEKMFGVYEYSYVPGK